VKALALLLLAAILAVVTNQGCAKQDTIAATVTVDVAFDALSTAYAYQSAKVQRESCDEYACVSVYECPAIGDCPAQRAVEKQWDPIWTAYESLATAVELGDSDSARNGYCKLRVAAAVTGVALPAPAYECPGTAQ
jgi:hypothetical protein